LALLIQNPVMPIMPEHRWLYPIDWSELSKLIRFGRAKGRCEHCQRPMGPVSFISVTGAGGMPIAGNGATDGDGASA
jgi:hypothetical protein